MVGGSSFIKSYNRGRASCARACVRSGSTSRKTDFCSVDRRSIDRTSRIYVFIRTQDTGFHRERRSIRQNSCSPYTIRFVAELLAHETRVADARGPVPPTDLKVAGQKKARFQDETR